MSVIDQLEKAHKTVCDLCQQRIKWVMSIPGRPDVDPDLIIGGAIREAQVAITFLESQLAATQERERVLREALLSVEWIPFEGHGNKVFCPKCYRWNAYGHTDNCSVKAALAQTEPGKESEVKP